MKRLLFALFGLLLTLSETSAGDLKAGAFAQDVSPWKFPISVNGGFSDVQATAIHDPIHARCLVLDDGKTKLAIAVVDSCMLPRELIMSAKEKASKATGIPTSNILVSATHTHYAPTATGVFQSEPDADYVPFLAEKIAEGIDKAHQRRVPAQLGFAKARDEENVFVRRWKREHALIPADPFGNTTDRVQMNPGHQVKGLLEPTAKTDPEIALLSVQTREGKPLAILANYSLHYVGGFPAISADYYGAYADRLKQLVAPDSPDFVAIMSNGTSGNVNNINYGQAAIPAKAGERIRVVSESVATKSAAALKEVTYGSDVSLAAFTTDLQLGVRKPNEKDLTRAREILAAQKNPKQLVGAAAVYARESLLLDKYPEHVPVQLQVLRIGDTLIAAIPCEVFTEIGLEIKKSSPAKNTFTIELANGYNGYLPTPEQHALGGYETWRARSSYLEVEASVKILDELKKLMKK